MQRSTMSLKQFLLRQKVLKLYKDILRSIRRVPTESDRQELRDWARREFKQNKNEVNEDAIRLMITHGQRSLKELEQSLDLSAS